MVRQMAAAGKFYPNDSSELKEFVDEVLSGVRKRNSRTYGGLVPHAGYNFSGKVAAEFYGSMNRTPETYILLGPNHTGRGLDISISSEDWESPLGKVPVDQELVTEIHELSEAEYDEGAHHYEHSLEVQLPFLQRASDEDFEIVPISIGFKGKDRLVNLGEKVAEAVKNLSRDVIIITSSDMMHYGSQYGYTPFPEDQVPEKVEELDRKLLEIIMSYNVDEMYDWIERRGYTMCGYGAAATMLSAVENLIPEKKRSKLLSYDTSFSVMEEPSSVVGYAAVTFEGK